MIADRRIEKFAFPGGEVLISESHIETSQFCFRDCEPQRPSKLSLHLSPRLASEEVGEIRPRADSDCCLLEYVKPIRLERSGELQAIIFGKYLFTKWDREPPGKRRWNLGGEDLETGYFLRHSPCKSVSFVYNGPPPCLPNDRYQDISVDLSVPVARFSRKLPEAGWPAVLVYSAPARTGWLFDFERTVRENPTLRYQAFPSGLQVEARFLQAEGEYSPDNKTPEDFTRHFPASRVILQRRLPISTTAWTTVSAATGGSGRYSYEFRAAYGDPDPDWVTVYSRFTGWEGRNSRFLRIGEWLAFGASGTNKPNTTVAGFIRLVRGTKAN